MFVDNAGCDLPCWWGITPGNTSWSEARSLLARIALGIRPGEPYSQVGPDGVLHHYESYVVDYPVAGEEFSGYTELRIKDGVVEELLVGPVGTQIRFSVSGILSTLGRPFEVFVYTYPEPVGDGVLPFVVLLFYPGDGVLAVFSGQGERAATLVRRCIQPDEAPSLTLWDPVSPRSIEDVNPVDGDASSLRTLRTSTGMTTGQFTRAFAAPGAIACLETPASVWE
jgi:hypothetical protein